MTGILLISSTNGIALFLVAPFLVIIHQGTIVITFIPVLYVILIFLAFSHSAALAVVPARGSAE